MEVEGHEVRGQHEEEEVGGHQGRGEGPGQPQHQHRLQQRREHARQVLNSKHSDIHHSLYVELETKVKRRFAKISQRRPHLGQICLPTQRLKGRVGWLA